MQLSLRREVMCLWPVLTVALACLVVPLGAQETTTKTIEPGTPEVKTEVRSGEVVYVSGNDLVVRMDDGQVKNFIIPDGSRFHVDGKDVTIHDLKPGTHLSQAITTTLSPRTVGTVRTVEGIVWSTMPPKTVVLTLPDGTNKQYTVPEGARFNIHGTEGTVFDLTKGLKVSATVITESPETVISTKSTVTGKTPPLPTPSMEGVLLVEETSSTKAP